MISAFQPMISTSTQPQIWASPHKSTGLTDIPGIGLTHINQNTSLSSPRSDVSEAGVSPSVPCGPVSLLLNALGIRVIRLRPGEHPFTEEEGAE